MKDKTCINCTHKDVCYMYRLNFFNAGEGYCTNYDEDGTERVLDVFMTNEEVKIILKKFYSLDDKENEALNRAIKALEFINENFPESFKDYLNGDQYRE